MIERKTMEDIWTFSTKVACCFYKKDKREETKIQNHMTPPTLITSCVNVWAQGTQCLPTTRILLKFHLEKKSSTNYHIRYYGHPAQPRH